MLWAISWGLCTAHSICPPPPAPTGDSPLTRLFSSVGKVLLLAHLSAFLTCLRQEGESSSPASWWLETRIRPTQGGWFKHGLFASFQAEHPALPPPELHHHDPKLLCEPLPTRQWLSGGIPATPRLEGLLTVCHPPVFSNSCLSSLLRV